MPKYSLRLLLAAISMACVFLAMLLVPRGRINETACSELQQGMSVEDAISIIGLPPDWYDGVTAVSGIPPSNSKLGNVQVRWLNRSGAIVANVKDGLQDIEYFDKNQLSIHHDFGRLFYDRTVDRVYESQSLLATILILAIIFLLPMMPIIALAKLCTVDVRELATSALVVAFLVYLGAGLANSKWWWHHQSTGFFGIAVLIAGSAFVATLLMLVLRLTKRRVANQPPPSTHTFG